MGKLRKTLALGAFAGLVVPPIAAAIAKQRLVPVNDQEADEVALVTIFDGGLFASRATAFRGGSALCCYGGLDIDLRGAQLDPAGARLWVRSVFGGVRVIVPESWQVRVRSTPIMAGVDDDTTGGSGGGPILDIDALAVFSGVRVTSRLADDDELIAPPGGEPAYEVGAEARADELARAEQEAVAEAGAATAEPDAEAGAATAEPEGEAAAEGSEAGTPVEAPPDEAKAGGDAPSESEAT